MSLLFLLLGVVLLVSIIASTIDPYDQIAFANVERLRASMDEACFTGSPVTVSDFKLPQTTPKFTSLVSVMPIWIIRTNGDPNFVLYYESYPPGDATGWEIYQGMENRLVTHLPDGFDDRTREDVITHVESVRQLWHDEVVEDDSVELVSKKLEGIIVNNIMLDRRRSDFYYGPEGGFGSRRTRGDDWRDPGPVNAGPESAYASLGKFGEWRELEGQGETAVPSEGDNVFKFNNYKGMASFEKSAVKYAPCGDNSLCLKTRSGVHRFPLRQCGDIKYIEMKYDARDRTKIYTYGGATLVVLGATACILLTSGVCGLVGAGGAVSAATAAQAVPVAPGVYAATVGTGAAAETVPIFISYSASGAATAYTTAAATTTTGLSLTAVLARIGGGAWWAAKGFVKQLLRHPIRTTSISVGAAGGASIATYKIGEFITSAFLSYKIQDFNIASDCSIKEMKIEKVPCDDMECSNAVSYPMYQYKGGGKLQRIGEHYTCMEKIGDKLDDPSDASTGFNGGQCLRVTVEEKAGGFCWTPDPFKDTWLSDTQAVASVLGFYPINENTEYLSGGSVDATLLKYYPQGDLESWKEFFERRLSWGWPS